MSNRIFTIAEIMSLYLYTTAFGPKATLFMMAIVALYAVDFALSDK